MRSEDGWSPSTLSGQSCLPELPHSWKPQRPLIPAEVRPPSAHLAALQRAVPGGSTGVLKWFRNGSEITDTAVLRRVVPAGPCHVPTAGRPGRGGGPEGLRDVPRATGEPHALWGHFWGWAEPLCGVFFYYY